MITMVDIARELGLSRATVSSVLNGRREGVWIGEETRARVLSTATALGYRRNEMARAMVTGTSRALGFVTDHPGSEHVARMLAGALDEADARGYTIQILRPRHEAEFDDRLAERAVELRLAGVVVLYIEGRALERLHDELTRSHVPLSLLDDNRNHPWGAPVVADYGEGMSLAVRHLAGLGHRRVALVLGRFSGVGAEARREAFEAALAAHGLPAGPGTVQRRESDPDAARASLGHWLSGAAHRPTAVIADTDSTALTLLRSGHDLGLRVPADLSVVGYGDLEMASLSTPALTTVHQPFEAMGRAAVRRLLSAIPEGGETELGRLEMIPGRLIVRETTGPAPDIKGHRRR